MGVGSATARLHGIDSSSEVAAVSSDGAGIEWREGIRKPPMLGPGFLVAAGNVEHQSKKLHADLL